MKRVALGAMILLLGSSAGASTTIYSHSFSGSGGAELSGVTLDTSVGVDGGVSGATWSAFEVKANGFNNGAAFSGAVVPFIPQSGRSYTLSATIDVTSNDGNWLGIGFSTTSTAGGFANVRAWMLDRGSAAIGNQAFVGIGTADGAVLSSTPMGPLMASIILDASSSDVSQWTAEWLVNGVSERGVTNLGLTTNDIGFVKLIAIGGAIGTFDDLLLTSAPEPSRALLFLDGLIPLLLIRRRVYLSTPG